MSKIVVFGAGGKAGRKAVTEAVSRGHKVIAVVRDPGTYADLAGPGISVVAGDVTDADSVAAAAAGADAAVSTVFRPDVPAGDFYRAAAEALVSGLSKANVGRLAVVGVGTVLEVSPGVAVHDTPGFPDGARNSLSATPPKSRFWMAATPPSTTSSWSRRRSSWTPTRSATGSTRWAASSFRPLSRARRPSPTPTWPSH